MKISFKATVHLVKRELRVVRAVYSDPRTPRVARWLLGLSLVYVMSPIDLVPDFIPVLGQLDDLILVPALVFLAFCMVPQGLYREHKQRLENSGAIPKSPSDA